MSMWRVRRSIIAATAVILLTTLVAAAAERSSTFQLDIAVPGQNVEIVGALSIQYDDGTCEGTWSFQGTVNGELARASGNGTCAFTQEAVTLTMTEIDTWDIEGFEPYTPRTVTISTPAGTPPEGANAVQATFSYDGQVFDVFGVPITISPGFARPIEGTYTAVSGTGVTSEDDGAESGTGVGGGEPGEALPNAGVRPEQTTSKDHVGPILAAMLAVGAGALLWRRGWLHPFGRG